MQRLHWLGAGLVAQSCEQLQCIGMGEVIAATGRSRGQRLVARRRVGPLAQRAAQHAAPREERAAHIIYYYIDGM